MNRIKRLSFMISLLLVVANNHVSPMQSSSGPLDDNDCNLPLPPACTAMINDGYQEQTLDGEQQQPNPPMRPNPRTNISDIEEAIRTGDETLVAWLLQADPDILSNPSNALSAQPALFHHLLAFAERYQNFPLITRLRPLAPACIEEAFREAVQSNRFTKLIAIVAQHGTNIPIYASVYSMLYHNASWPDFLGRTLLHRMCEHIFYGTGLSPQDAAFCNNHFLICRRQIIALTIQAIRMHEGDSAVMSYINKQDAQEQTALHVAATFHQPEIIEDLLELGANPLIPDCQGKIPLHIAAASGMHIPSISALLTSRHREEMLQFQTHKGQTALAIVHENQPLSEEQEALIGSGLNRAIMNMRREIYQLNEQVCRERDRAQAETYLNLVTENQAFIEQLERDKRMIPQKKGTARKQRKAYLDAIYLLTDGH